ncbi:MAG: bacterial transcriptional activator domain-containing protein [Dermatophilaceae bacterium]
MNVDVEVVRKALAASVVGREELEVLMTTRELLPGWSGEWVEAERSQIGTRRTSVLSRAAQRLLAEQELALATAVARQVVDAEPYSEMAHRLLASVYLEGGDPVMALRTYQSYAALAMTEVGLTPSATFQKMVEPLLREMSANPPENPGGGRGLAGPVRSSHGHTRHNRTMSPADAP